MLFSVRRFVLELLLFSGLRKRYALSLETRELY